MQQKYELRIRLTYFWNKNEKKVSLNFIFCIRGGTFLTHMSQLFIIEICFTKKYNTICGGGQLLVSGSQGPIFRAPSVRFPGPRIQELEVPSPRVLGSQVLGYQVPGPRYQVPGNRVLGCQVPDLRVLSLGPQGPKVLGPRILGPRSEVLILDYALNLDG